MNIDRNIQRRQTVSEEVNKLETVDAGNGPKQDPFLYHIKHDSNEYHFVLPSARIIDDESTSGLLPVNDIISKHIDAIVAKADEVQTSFALYCGIDAQIRQRKLVMKKLGVDKWIIPVGEPGGEDLDMKLENVKEVWEERKAELAVLIERKDHISVAEERFTVKMAPRVRKPARTFIVSDEESSDESDDDDDDDMDDSEVEGGEGGDREMDESMDLDDDESDVEDEGQDKSDDSDEDDTGDKSVKKGDRHERRGEGKKV